MLYEELTFIGYLLHSVDWGYGLHVLHFIFIIAIWRGYIALLYREYSRFRDIE